MYMLMLKGTCSCLAIEFIDHYFNYFRETLVTHEVADIL